MQVIMKGMIFILQYFLFSCFSFLDLLKIQMTVNKQLPDAMWLLAIDFITDGQVCPLSLGVVDKRRQLLVTHFRVNRRLTLRYH